MEADLYNVKQYFTLGAYGTIANLPLSASSEDYASVLLYKIRSLIALNRPKAALSLLPSSSTSSNLAFKAARALATYVSLSTDKVDADTDTLEEAKEKALESLRDLCVESEGEESEGDVKVLAATAFAHAGEVEEALETLGVGSESNSQNQNLEATQLITHIYLTINRPDLAARAASLASKWAEDDLLLGHLESSISLITGTDNTSSALTFFTEQLANPSFQSSSSSADNGNGNGNGNDEGASISARLATALGVTRLCRGEVKEARSILEEALSSGGHEALSAEVVAASLAPTKKGEADELFTKLASQYPTSPYVLDIEAKSKAFDVLAASYIVPPLAA